MFRIMLKKEKQQQKKNTLNFTPAESEEKILICAKENENSWKFHIFRVLASLLCSVCFSTTRTRLYADVCCCIYNIEEGMGWWGTEVGGGLYNFHSTAAHNITNEDSNRTRTESRSNTFCFIIIFFVTQALPIAYQKKLG